MYTWITILISLFVVISIIRFIMNRNWKLFFTTFGYDEYFRIISKLKAQGIKVKTQSPFRNFGNDMSRYNENTQFDIYVKKEEEHLAVKVMQN